MLRILCVFLAANAIFCAVQAEESPFLLGGIQVHEKDHRRWTSGLRASGMNTVAVTVYAHQGDWDSADLWWSEEEPAVVAEIRAAREAGLRVVLILRVAVDHAYPRNEFIWHGMIMPKENHQLDEWFRRYTEFAVKWAKIARAEGVDLFGVGSEMNALNETLPIRRRQNMRNYYVFYWYHRLYRRWLSRNGDPIEERHLWVRGRENYDSLEAFLDKRFRVHRDWARQVHFRGRHRVLRKVNERRRRINDHWLELIRRVRENYEGPLTYAANFDSYMNVGFWRELDVMGVNAYFPLREDPALSLEAREESAVYRDSWRTILGKVERFREEQALGEMPLIFSELGYTSRRHTTVQPWSHGTFSIVGWRKTKRLLVWDDQPMAPEERARAVDALHDVHLERGGSPLAGILYWKLSTHAEHVEIEPFVLIIGEESGDPLLPALARFLAEKPADVARVEEGE